MWMGWEKRQLLHRVAPAAAIAALLAGCALPVPMPSRDDPQVQHPLVVEREVVKLNVAFAPGTGNFSPKDGAALDRYLAGYVAQGAGPLRVSVASPTGEFRFTPRQVVLIRDRAAGHGAGRNEIVASYPTGEEGPRGAAELSFTRFIVHVPNCGDWSKDAAFNPSNTVHSNYGCISQRNFGLMLAQPADLVSAQARDTRDTARSNLVIQKYRAGETTITKSSAEEKTITSVTK